MSGLIPQVFIDNLLERTDLAALIGTRVVLKKGSNNSFKACCPFHDERTPSFNVRPDKGFYHCFGCGAHGDAISFLRELDHLSFNEAIEALAQRVGLEVPYDHQARQEMEQTRTLTQALDFAARFYQQALQTHPQSDVARQYLQQRGLSPDIIERYGLGFAPAQGNALAQAADKATLDALIGSGTVQAQHGRPRDLLRNRITFPIRNSRGRTIAFGGRTLGDDKAKYINSPESDVFHKSHEVYGLHEVLQQNRKLERLLVVEGYMDVIALAQFGITCAVAALGTATNSDNISTLLRHSKHLIFCFDGDQAGYRAADRAMDNALELLEDGIHLQFLILPEGEDPDTLIRKEGAAAFQARMDAATPLSQFLFQRHSEGLDLQLPENRGELRARSLPQLKRITSQTLRDAMFEMLQRLCKPPRPDYFGSKKPAESPVPFQSRIGDVKRGRDIALCLGLVANPALAEQVMAFGQQYGRLQRATQLAEWIIQRNLSQPAELMAALATNKPARDQFEHLFDELEHIPGTEEILEEAAAILTPDDESQMKAKIRQLTSQVMRASDLSDDNRSALKALTQPIPVDSGKGH